MVLDLQILNTDAVLNAFQDIGNAEFVQGQPLKIVMRLQQRERNLRYVPESGTTFSMDFITSDGSTVISKTPIALDASDRSLVVVTLTATETQTLISQNLTLQVTEPTAGDTVAVRQMGLKAITLENC